MEIIASLLALSPLWVVATIITGLIIGFLTASIKIDKRTIQLLLLFYAPFALSRLIIVLFFGAAISSGTGYIGVLLINIYILAILLGRKLGREGDD